ncbi:MAG: UbiD family decarboxylase [Bacillota bacterium]
MAPVAADLRAWLGELEEQGLLKRVRRRVDPVYELGAVTRAVDGTAAVLFEDVCGHPVPAVSNICANRDMYARGVDTTAARLVEKVTRALAAPRPGRVVSRQDAPVKENIITSGINLYSLLPVPTYHEKDAGPYITAGVLIAQDPVTGCQNLSIHRLQVTGPGRLGILILPRHLWHYFQGAETASRGLPVAIAIGLAPSVLLASQAITALGVDEVEIASALAGEPVELVAAETSSLLVPARAELVIEGELLAGVREEEGPFGEYPRCYGPAAPRPVIHVNAVTHRHSPIYHTILPASQEHLLMGGIMREASLFKMVEQAVPSVQAVHLTPGGNCRYHAVVKIAPRHRGEAKNAILAALNSSQEVKLAVVVDEDIDIFDPQDVEWAISTRVQADRDLVVIGDTLASRLDPSTSDGVGARLGIDATIPWGAPRDRFEKIRIPGQAKVDLQKYFG